MNRRDFIASGCAAIVATVAIPVEVEPSIDGFKFVHDIDPIRGFFDSNGNFVQVERWLQWAGLNEDRLIENAQWVNADIEIRIGHKDGELICLAVPNPNKNH